MIGKFLSGVIKVATIPIDIAETGLDLATGGDGSRKELKQADLPLISTLRDEVTKAIEKIDE